jgi:hypothetical protein
MILLVKRNMNFKFKTERDIPRLLLVVFLLVVLFSKPLGLDLNQYNEILLVCITAIYAYFTYELLRITKNNRSFPYIKVDFVVASSLSSDFFDQYRQDVVQNQAFTTLDQHDETVDQDGRNIVFLRVENTGESLAINVEVKIKFDRKNYLQQEEEGLYRTIHLKDLKSGEASLELLELFEHPSSNNYYKITNIELTHSDAVRFNSDESPFVRNLTKNAGQDLEEGTLVNFIIQK